jgi:hypothetical protein
VIAGPALAQDVTGSIPKAGALDHTDVGGQARLPLRFWDLSVLLWPEGFLATPLGSYVVVQACRTEPNATLNIVLSPQPLGELAALDRGEAAVTQR